MLVLPGIFLILDMPYRVVLITAFALVLSVCCFAEREEKPNILFVIADDWSFPHAGAYGDKVVRTPNIDEVARLGVLFTNAFTAAPSCTPSRAAILTGRYPHELEQGANLWGFLPKQFDNYTTILEQAGYYVGLNGKGWGPGNFQAGGYEHNPAGKSFKNFAAFLEERPDSKPFSFWFGSQNPHRPYESGAGAKSGLHPDQVVVPGWLPDVAEARNDILDYYYEVEQFDRQLGELLQLLKSTGEYEKTLIVITGDNGMPFPRAKANAYDAGARIPLIISMPGTTPAMRVDDLVSLTDLAPTILELAGQTIPKEMSGESLWPLLTKGSAQTRHAVFIERERHANVRNPELGYPVRAIRTKDYLYIRNYAPERWPAGDPELYHSVGPFGDVDDSPSKQFILNNRRDITVAPFFERGFAKRPAHELYDLRKDPDQLNNVAADPAYKEVLAVLKKQLNAWQTSTADPRGRKGAVNFDSYPYYGPPVKGAPSAYKAPTNK